MIDALLAIAVASAAPVDWFGPATVEFRLETKGNPFDPAENDVRVRFAGPNGAVENRMAFYDGEGRWKAVLVANRKGRYVPSVQVNGHPADVRPAALDLAERLPLGFVRRHPDHVNRFRYDDGSPYWPVGHNLGWQGPGTSMADQIAMIGKNGGNWTRIWACHWDGKNPWWPQDDAHADLSQLWFPAIHKWDALVAACEKARVPMQLVLFHHGAFSSTVNANWPDHPWNAKNGGFLKSATEFFTDAEAKRRAKMWLRYAVARWGHSPGILAWELFNEVEWVDARYANKWDTIADWHAEMARYLRSLDPYRHLITSSSAMDQKALWAEMDYGQPHTYPVSVTNAVAGEPPLPGKPFFFGEFGGGGGSDFGAKERLVVRDGLYASLLANHAGAAQYWFWDRMERAKLYPEYERFARVLSLADPYEHPDAKPVELTVETAHRAPLIVSPGRGWAPSEVSRLDLPQDANIQKLGRLAGYFQYHRGGNGAMFPEPLTVAFEAAKPGEAKLHVTMVARQGASLKVRLNGKEVATKTFAGGSDDRNVNETVVVAFPKGRNELVFENSGPDWFVFDRIEVDGLAPQVRAMASGEDEWLVARLRGRADDAKIRLANPRLKPGNYLTYLVDLETGKERKFWTKRAKAGDPILVESTEADVLLILRRGEE
ncbi:MAG: hypothetical protein KIS66_05900 [Fimbriimonadaceae bacterium]|nr:hypothetical protein [Fimbriimonadaceae bacterium]